VGTKLAHRGAIVAIEPRLMCWACKFALRRRQQTQQIIWNAVQIVLGRIIDRSPGCSAIGIARALGVPLRSALQGLASQAWNP